MKTLILITFFLCVIAICSSLHISQKIRRSRRPGTGKSLPRVRMNVQVRKRNRGRQASRSIGNPLKKITSNIKIKNMPKNPTKINIIKQTVIINGNGKKPTAGKGQPKHGGQPVMSNRYSTGNGQYVPALRSGASKGNNRSPGHHVRGLGGTNGRVVQNFGGHPQMFSVGNGGSSIHGLPRYAGVSGPGGIAGNKRGSGSHGLASGNSGSSHGGMKGPYYGVGSAKNGHNPFGSSVVGISLLGGNAQGSPIGGSSSASGGQTIQGVHGIGSLSYTQSGHMAGGLKQVIMDSGRGRIGARGNLLDILKPQYSISNPSVGQGLHSHVQQSATGGRTNANTASKVHSSNTQWKSENSQAYPANAQIQPGGPGQSHFMGNPNSQSTKSLVIDSESGLILGEITNRNPNTGVFVPGGANAKTVLNPNGVPGSGAMVLINGVPARSLPRNSLSPGEDPPETGLDIESPEM